jgi:hypothetical protein
MSDNLFQKIWNVNGKRLIQQMDLNTDTALYRMLDGTLLMEVDSAGNCKDSEGKPFGRFRMNYPDCTWYYEPESEGNRIQSGSKLLFDYTEPVVVAQLFKTQLEA